MNDITPPDATTSRERLADFRNGIEVTKTTLASIRLERDRRRRTARARHVFDGLGLTVRSLQKEAVSDDVAPSYRKALEWAVKELAALREEARTLL